MGTTGTESGGVKERVVAMVVVVVGDAARLLCSLVVVMAVDHHLDFWMRDNLNPEQKPHFFILYKYGDE